MSTDLHEVLEALVEGVVILGPLAEIQSLKVGSKIDFSCFLMKFHPKSMLRNENKFFIPPEGLVRHFGLLLGFSPTR